MHSSKQNEQGQTLVLIVFVMIIALGIGVSISSRFISNIRMSSEAYLGSRAQAVAEAAVERILLLSYEELSNHIDAGTCESDCYLEILNDDGVLETATIELSYIGNTNDHFNMSLTVDNTVEVALTGYGNDLPINICWDAGTSGFDTPSIYGTIIAGNVGGYTSSAFAYNSSNHLYSNNFDTATSAHGFDSCASVNVGTDPQIMRFKSLYQDVDVTIVPHESAVLPSQGIVITSTGRVLDNTRVVTVIRGDSFVPGIFDNVLFSKSPNSPLSN